MGDGLEDPIIACAVSKGKDKWAVCVLGTGFTPATFSVVDVDNEETFTRSLHSPCAMCLEASGASVTEVVPVLLKDLGCASGSMRHLYPCPAAFVQDFAKLAKQTNVGCLFCLTSAALLVCDTFLDVLTVDRFQRHTKLEYYSFVKDSRARTNGWRTVWQAARIFLC